MILNASSDIGEYLDSLVNSPGGIDVELAPAHRFHDFFAQHEISQVLVGDQDSLVASQPFGLAHLEEAFYLLVNTSYGLYLTLLVDGAGDCGVLLNWHSRKARQYGI